MTVPVSEKRNRPARGCPQRILVLDGAMGTMIQGLEYDETAVSRRTFQGFPS